MNPNALLTAVKKYALHSFSGPSQISRKINPSIWNLIQKVRLLVQPQLMIS